MNTKSVILSIITAIIIAVVFFALGGGAGVLYQKQKDAPLINKAAASQAILQKLTSSVIYSIIVYGQASKIEGNDLTVSSNGKSVVVTVSKDTVITSFSFDEEGKTSQQNIDLNQIQQGRTVSVNTQLLPDGQLQANSVTVLPTR